MKSLAKCGAFFISYFYHKYLAMSKIEKSAEGAYQVIKTFHNDRIYLAGTAINVKNDKLSAELQAKGLIEQREVKVSKPAPKKRGRKSKTDDKK